MKQGYVAGPWVTLLAGVASLIVGVWVLQGQLRPLHQDWQRMQQWHSVPAELLRVDLESGGRGRETTWRVVAQYRYEVDGVGFLGDRVNLQPNHFSDNLGDYHRRMHRTLQQARRAGEVRVWFDPDDPADSVLDREFRREVAWFVGGFGGAFCFAGLLFIAIGIRRFRDPTFLRPG